MAFLLSNEAFLALAGLIICGIVGGIAWLFIDEAWIAAFPISAASIILACYFLIRLIHWAWETPIPFTQ